MESAIFRSYQMYQRLQDGKNYRFYNMIIFRVKYCFSKIKVRYLHKLQYQPTLFHLRNYVYTYLYAKSSQGNMLTLYEESSLKDPQINAEAFHQYLNWLNIYPESKEEEPILLGEYKDKYIGQLKQLIKNDKVYLCFCKNKVKAYDGTCRSLSTQQVQNRLRARHPYKVRLKQPEKTIKYNDLIYGDVQQDPRQDPVIEDPSSGMSTQFKAVIADKQEQVTHVFHNHQTLKQLNEYLTIANALQIPTPIFIALPPLVCPQIRTTTLQKLRKQQFEPAAIVNFMALLGWRPFGESANNLLKQIRQFVFSTQDLIKYFDIDKITKRPINYELDKLRTLNKLYLKKDIKQKLNSKTDGLEAFRQRLNDLYGQSIINNFSNQYLTKALKIISQTIKKWSQLNNYSFMFLKKYPLSKPKIAPELELKINNNLILILKHIIRPEQFNQATFAQKLSQFLQDFQKQITPQQFYKYLKYCVCGQPNFKSSAVEVCGLLGHSQTLSRIQKSRPQLKSDISVY